MSARHEPRRLLSVDDDALSSHFKDALVEYRELGPGAAAHDRNWRALASQLSAPPLAAAASKRPWRAFVAGVGCTVLLGSVAWFVSTRLDARSDRVLLGTKSAHAVPRATNATLSPARTEPDHLAPSVAKDRAAPAESASAMRALPHRRAVAAVPTHPAHSELDLLTRARRVVSSAPGRALELASEHARDYPTGAFAQEREVLAIDALQRLERRAEAVGRAQRFRAAYPTSTYLPHIQAIVDAP